MNRCKNCKHWGESERAQYRICRIACSRDGDPMRDVGDDYDLLPNDGALAFALDGSEYSARLITAPDFGCVQWEACE